MTAAIASLLRLQPNRIPVIALLAANGVSMTGNMITRLAIPWFVLETTGSAAQTGLAGFFSVLPIIIASFFGGTIVDRIGFKRMSIVSDLLSGLAVAMIPLLHHTVGLAFWQLLGCVFLGALLDAPGATARAALFPDIVARAGMRLERGNAFYDAINRLSQLLGPPLAGGLIALIGASNVLWLDAVTFAVSALMVAVAVPGLQTRNGDPGRYLDQILDGLQFLRRDRLLWSLALVVALTNFFDIALFGVLLPVFSQNVLGSAQAFGLLVGATGGGGFAGSLIFGAVGHRLPRRETFIGAFMILAIQWAVLATQPSLAVCMVTFAACSVGAGSLNPLLNTLRQERVPPELRGRVFGTMTAIAWVAMPLGAVLGGLLVEAFGLRITLLAGGACFFLVTSSMLFNPALREMNRAPVTAA